MTLRLFGVRVHVHPLLPALLSLSAILGEWEAVPAACAAFALHEAGHLLMARVFGLRPSALELTPFGGVMTVEGLDSAGRAAAFLIALGGPLFSLLGFLLCPLLLRFSALPFSALAQFARYQWLLFLINLLPVLPLDGGGMLLAALGRFLPEQAVRRSLTQLAIFLGAGLCALSLLFALRGQLNFGPCFAGCFLLYAAMKEKRQFSFAYVTGLIARRQRIAEGRVLPVQGAAASGALPLRSLLPHLASGKYHMVFVLSPDGLTVLGTLDEQQLCEQLLQNTDARLMDCLSPFSGAKKKAPATEGAPFPGAFRQEKPL